MKNLQDKKTEYLAQEKEYRQISERIARQTLEDFHNMYSCASDTVDLYRGDDIFPLCDYQDWGVIYKNKRTGHYSFGVNFKEVKTMVEIEIEWNYEKTAQKKDWLYRCQFVSRSSDLDAKRANKKIVVTPDNTEALGCALYDYIKPYFSPALFIDA